eukprot:3798116-Rhodomonas_salina.2
MTSPEERSPRCPPLPLPALSSSRLVLLSSALLCAAANRAPRTGSDPTLVRNGAELAASAYIRTAASGSTALLPPNNLPLPAAPVGSCSVERLMPRRALSAPVRASGAHRNEVWVCLGGRGALTWPRARKGWSRALQRAALSQPEQTPGPITKRHRVCIVSTTLTVSHNACPGKPCVSSPHIVQRVCSQTMRAPHTALPAGSR